MVCKSNIFDCLLCPQHSPSREISYNFLKQPVWVLGPSHLDIPAPLKIIISSEVARNYSDVIVPHKVSHSIYQSHH